MLPKMIDPRRSADQDIEYQDVMQAGLLPRLADAVSHIDTDATVQVRVYRDEQRRMRIQGKTAIDVHMVCQRCLQPCEEQLEAEIDLVVVYTEDHAKKLPKELDAWVVSESADLHELIEDELLLAMPLVAYHRDSSCSVPEEYRVTESSEQQERQSPFAVLKELANSPD